MRIATLPLTNSQLCNSLPYFRLFHSFYAFFLHILFSSPILTDTTGVNSSCPKVVFLFVSKILKPVKICQLLQLFYLRFYCLVICFVYFLEFFQMFFTCISKVRSIVSLFFKVLYLESNKLESHDFLGNILFCFYNNASNVFR